MMYIEYVCNSYHKNGIDNCSSHRIRQAQLDEAVGIKLESIRMLAKENAHIVKQFIEYYKKQKIELTDSIKSVTMEISKLEEQVVIVSEKA